MKTKRITKKRASMKDVKEQKFVIRTDWKPQRRSTSYVYDPLAKEIDKLKMGHSLHFRESDPLYTSVKGIGAKYNKLNPNQKVGIYTTEEKGIKYLVIYKY